MNYLKKLFLTFVLVVTTTAVFSQDYSNKNALGIRFADDEGFGGEISYQLYVSKSNRLEFDLGWRDFGSTNTLNSGDVYKFTGLYQWIRPLKGRFNWYFGGGAGLGYFDYNTGGENGIFLRLAGNLGMEYDFDNIPLLISLDLRPELGGNHNNITNNKDLYINLGLSLRYQF